MTSNNSYNFWYFIKYDDANPANRTVHRANNHRSTSYQEAINANSTSNALSAYSLALAAQVEAEARHASPKDALIYYKKAERWSKIAAMAALSKAEAETTMPEVKIRFSNLALKAYDKREELKAIIENLENTIMQNEQGSQLSISL